MINAVVSVLSSQSFNAIYGYVFKKSIQTVVFIDPQKATK